MKKRKTTNSKYLREQFVFDISSSSLNEIEQKLSCKLGVNEIERKERQLKYGENKLIISKFNHWKKIKDILIQPFNLLLLFIGSLELLLYFFRGLNLIDLISSILILFMIFLAGIVDYIQELKAYKSNLELHALVENTFPVYNGDFSLDLLKNDNSFVLFKKNLKRLDQSFLTIGDVIFLEKGDVIPADIRILYQKDLAVNESSLTGESDMVIKNIFSKKNEQRMIELSNIIFAQTIIERGFAIGVVINVGEQNYANSILKIAEEKNNQTDYEKGLKKITKVLIIGISMIIPLIFLSTGLKTADWLSALTFSLSISVALIPESLPAIVSSNLRIGIKKMVKNKIVVKNWSAVQNLGSVNVLCTDKTGTLTENDNLVLNKWINYDNVQTEYLTKLLFLGSYFQQNFSNKIDQAVLKTLENFKIDDKEEYELLKEISFDHNTRRNSLLIKKINFGETLQIVKGSSWEVLNHTKFVRNRNKIVELTERRLKKINETINIYAKQGYRCIVICSRQNVSSIKMDNLIFEGFVFFEEQIKDGAIKAIKSISDYNVNLKILTGDSLDITRHISQNLGLPNKGATTGMELEKVNSHTYHQKIQQSNIFAKLSPVDKFQIIETLQADNQTVVAFLGDGTNDAIALKSADVGISVNNGTPLAKSAASIILLEKDLDVVKKAFIQGRKIFTNAVKYINITIAANFGLILSLLISSIFFKFQAMLPIQLLLQNLIFDFANLIFVFDDVDDYSIKSPLKWRVKNMIVFALWNGIVFTLISIINFLVMGYGFNLFKEISSSNPISLLKFQTGFFIESTLTHMFLICVYRTENISWIDSRPSWTILFGIGFFVLITIALVFVCDNFKNSFFASPNPFWWTIMILLLLITWTLGEISKFFYKKFFGRWF